MVSHSLPKRTLAGIAALGKGLAGGRQFQFEQPKFPRSLPSGGTLYREWVSLEEPAKSCSPPSVNFESICSASSIKAPQAYC